jgi:hypothetical protein
MGNPFPSLPQRLTPSIQRPQDLRDVLLQSLRVALPGIVQSFDPGPPAAVTVLIATNEFVQQTPDDFAEGDPLSVSTTAMQLPLLSDVPILIPSGGKWSFTLPIQAGDECMVVFLDTMLDQWFQNGDVNNNPTSQRRHSLSDAIAVFGLRSTPNAIENYSTDSAQLRSDDGTVIIDLKLSQITVTAPKVVVNTTGDCDLSVSGTVNISGGQVDISSTTTIQSRGFLSHSHSGVTPGSGESGGVV